MKWLTYGLAQSLFLLAVRLNAQIPPEAQARAQTLFESGLSVSGDPADQSSIVDGDAVHVTVKRAGATPYTVQVMSGRNRAPIHVGDVLFITFESSSTSPDGGVWLMYAQQSQSPWATYFTKQAVVGTDWRRFNFKWVADKELPANAMRVTFHVSSQAQELQFRGFAAINLGRYAGNLPFTPVTYPGREPDAPWRKEADARIDRYRKANLTLRLTDSSGKPVANAKVHVRQLRHAYEFGSFVEDPLLWKNSDGDRYRDWFLRAYNKATTPMYWADWGWENPETYAHYFQFPQWLRAHDYPIKAHVLIYPGWQFLPSRLARYKNDADGLWREIERHVREKLAATKPFGFVSWDVTNETRDLKDLPKLFGSEEVYVKLYKMAHELDPSPTLYLNENTILTAGGKTEPQQTEYERMIRYLLSRGAPLQGIGMQAHFGEALTAPTEIWRIVDRFAKFGLPIQITEFDLPIDDVQAQADYTRDLLTAWFAHPATTGFTMWGFWAGSMWQPKGALVDKNWNVLPNGRAWLDLVTKRWWTDANVTTDARGSASLRVFKGDYEITAGDQPVKATVVTDRNLVIKR